MESHQGGGLTTKSASLINFPRGITRNTKLSGMQTGWLLQVPTSRFDVGVGGVGSRGDLDTASNRPQPAWSLPHYKAGPRHGFPMTQTTFPGNRTVMTHWQLMWVTTAANVRLTARSCRTHTPISKFWKTRSGSGELRRAGARDRGPDSGNRHRRGGPTSPGNHGAHILVVRDRRDGQHRKR